MRNGRFNNNNYEDNSELFKFGNRHLATATSPADNQVSNEESLMERVGGQVENESLESTRRALRSLNESHEVGTRTAEELVRQGEQLQRVDERLSDVNSTLTATQRNLNQVSIYF
jgi:succinate dehydrogenase/fumarate reductase flavoprotein subunit